MSDPGDPRLQRQAFVGLLCLSALVLYKLLGLLSALYSYGGFDPANWH